MTDDFTHDPHVPFGTVVVCRKYGEAVYIGDALVIVEKGKSGRVKLVIKAPKDMPVDREERVQVGA